MNRCDRLIELLIESYENNARNGFHFNADAMAKYLLSYGVDIPLCKVGRVVYTIEGCNNRPEKLVVTAVHQYEKYTSITALSKSQKEYFYEDADFGEIVFFKKGEAEQALIGGAE